MKVRSYMTPRPERVERSFTVREAILEMERGGFRHLLVVDGPVLVGIVSRRELDMICLVEAIDPSRTSVEVAMTPVPVQVQAETSLTLVASKMIDAKVGSVVVMDDDDIAGIFTTVDALKALAELSV